MPSYTPPGCIQPTNPANTTATTTYTMSPGQAVYYPTPGLMTGAGQGLTILDELTPLERTPGQPYAQPAFTRESLADATARLSGLAGTFIERRVRAMRLKIPHEVDHA